MGEIFKPPKKLDLKDDKPIRPLKPVTRKQKERTVDFKTLIMHLLERIERLEKEVKEIKKRLGFYA